MVIIRSDDLIAQVHKIVDNCPLASRQTYYEGDKDYSVNTTVVKITGTAKEEDRVSANLYNVPRVS